MPSWAGENPTDPPPPSPPRTKACPGAWSQPERGIPHSSERCEGREAGLGLSPPHPPSGRAVKSELFSLQSSPARGRGSEQAGPCQPPQQPPPRAPAGGTGTGGVAQPPLPCRIFQGASVRREPAIFSRSSKAASRLRSAEVPARLVPRCSQLLALAGRDSRTQHAPITGVTRAAAASPLLHGARRPLTREEAVGRPWPQRSAALPPPSHSGGWPPTARGPGGPRVAWTGGLDGLDLPAVPGAS